MLKIISSISAINTLIDYAKKTGKKLYAFQESWQGIPCEVVSASKETGHPAFITVTKFGQSDQIEIEDEIHSQSITNYEAATAITRGGERVHIVAMEPPLRQEY